MHHKKEIVFLGIALVVLLAGFLSTAFAADTAPETKLPPEQETSYEEASPLFALSLDTTIDEFEGTVRAYPNQVEDPMSTSPTPEILAQVTTAADTCYGLDCPGPTTGQPGERCHYTYQSTCNGYTCEGDCTSGSSGSPGDGGSSSALIVVVVLLLLLAAAAILFILWRKKVSAAASTAGPMQASLPATIIPTPTVTPPPTVSQPQRFCSECGKSLSPTDRFCRACGKQVERPDNPG